jgi:peptide/nickel transport system ATP-binding protein
VSSAPALEVDALTVRLDAGGGPVTVVRDVSLRIDAGHAFGLVGESGAGKSTIALALLGLLPATAEVTGSIRVDGHEIVGRAEAELQRLRGARVSVVLQDPATALNPVWTVGAQMAEAVAAHRAISTAEAGARAVELLSRAGIPDAAHRAAFYPHQLSGGLRQRVAIALAMANEPALIVADEPTSALDSTVQRQVLDALIAAREATGAALLLISHDLGVVEGAVDTVGVLSAGALVEVGPVGEVLRAPRMPYTRWLVQSRPRLGRSGPQPLAVLDSASFAAAGPVGTPAGCPFARRCPYGESICHATVPALEPVGAEHAAACHLVEAVRDRPWPASAVAAPKPVTQPDAGPILEGRKLVRHFSIHRGHRRGDANVVHAVDDVDLVLHPGATLGLVGASGSGKTTLARLLAGIEQPTSGSIRFRDQDTAALGRARRRQYRRDVQLISQDPAAALDPLMTAGATVDEPLRILGQSRTERERRVAELLAQVGIDPVSDRHRYPNELSSGQRQRVAIARALAMEPNVLLLDEPVSNLDAPTRAGVLALLLDLQARLDLAYLFVSHDLAVVQFMADRIAVMHLGRIVEVADRDELIAAPRDPYTRALVASALA